MKITAAVLKFVITFYVGLTAAANASAQVNSGSNGSDGALNPTSNLVIDMADHPDGIYHYTSVNIPAGVTVSFIPNASNTPVIWLVQGTCQINGVIQISGKQGNHGARGEGGPGGFAGGNGGGAGVLPGAGAGPGGALSSNTGWMAGNASFVSLGGRYPSFTIFGVTKPEQDPPGIVYGSQFLVPLVGGSGGAGHTSGVGGGGGGGALLIAANTQVVFNGSIQAEGGGGDNSRRAAGGGSGGAVRIVAEQISGNGFINTTGGICYEYYNSARTSSASHGRVRLDALDISYTGSVVGDVTRGYQPIIIPPANQAVGLAIQSVGGVAVVASPTGTLTTPDVIVAGSQPNPIPIVVRCVNIPLNTEIIVEVKPANGATIRAVGLNVQGTQAGSTATVHVNMPRGGGTIQAKAVSGIAGSLGAGLDNGGRFRHYAQTGLTADGERFAKMEITATLGRGQDIAYITESGKRFVLPRN